MQLVIEIPDNSSAKTIAQHLRMRANTLEGMDPKAAASVANTASPTSNGVDHGEALTAADDVAPPKKTKAPAKKAAAVAEEEDFDLGIGDDEEAAEEEKVITLTDVINGFKVFAKTKGRDKAAAVLKKFKAKSVQELKADQYAAVLEAIAV